MCANKWSGSMNIGLFVAGYFIGGTDEADEGVWIWAATGRYVTKHMNNTSRWKQVGFMTTILLSQETGFIVQSQSTLSSC